MNGTVDLFERSSFWGMLFTLKFFKNNWNIYGKEKEQLEATEVIVQLAVYKTCIPLVIGYCRFPLKLMISLLFPKQSIIYAVFLQWEMNIFYVSMDGWPAENCTDSLIETVDTAQTWPMCKHILFDLIQDTIHADCPVHYLSYCKEVERIQCYRTLQCL